MCTLVDAATNWLVTVFLGAIIGTFLTGWIVMMLWIVRSNLDMWRERKATGARASEIGYRFSSELWSSPDRAPDRDRFFFVLKCVGATIALTLLLAGIVALRNSFFAT